MRSTPGEATPDAPMHPFGHIACWVDGPTQSAGALDVALALWADADGRLSLLHGAAGRADEDPATRAAEWRRRRTGRLTAAEPVFLTGEPGAAACEWARQEGADLIVVDVRSGRLPGLEPGGLADHLLERAPCSVLVTRPAGAGRPGGFRRIACCLDGAPADEAAIRVAQALCGEDARLSLVHVARRPPPAELIGAWPAGGAEGAVAALPRAEEALAAGIPGAESILLEGSPGPALCRWAESAGCDLVVVSSRHPGRWGMSVLGSVTRHLVDHAPCPLLAVGPVAAREAAERPS
jgi:nucleotide-binding universal stress UspA family protein